MRFPLIGLFAASTLLMSGCDRGRSDATSQPENAETASAVAASPSSASESGSIEKKAGIWFEPEALSACEKAGKVMVHWDISAQTEVKVVNVMTIRPNGKEGMFAPHARPAGMKETGTWMQAGRQLVVRSAADGSELARASLGSFPCEAGATTPK